MVYTSDNSVKIGISKYAAEALGKLFQIQHFFEDLKKKSYNYKKFRCV